MLAAAAAVAVVVVVVVVVVAAAAAVAAAAGALSVAVYSVPLAYASEEPDAAWQPAAGRSQLLSLKYQIGRVPAGGLVRSDLQKGWI